MSFRTDELWDTAVKLRQAEEAFLNARHWVSVLTANGPAWQHKRHGCKSLAEAIDIEKKDDFEMGIVP